jgi:hypothetical protein
LQTPIEYAIGVDMREFGLATTGLFAILFLSGGLFLLPPSFAVAIFIAFLIGIPFVEST